MRIAIDAIVIIGGLLISAGVLISFGIGYALIAFGSMLIAFGLKSAKIYELNNVSDAE